MEQIRSLVRPTVTWGLVAGFIAAAFLDLEAAKLIAAPMGIALGFWFSSRDHKRPPE